MGAVKVLAPYVTLPVTDANGSEVVLGFYAGAVVENVAEGDVLDRHLEQGLVEKASVKDATGPLGTLPEEPEKPAAKRAAK